MSDSINNRIEKLQPRIHRVAHYEQFQTALLDRDDVEQEMTLRVLEHAQSIPNYINQTDSYILRDAFFGGLMQRRSEKIYLSYVNGEDYQVCNDNDGYIDISVFELIPDSTPNPEDAAILQEEISTLEQAIVKMTPSNQQIVKMLLEGYSESEIADHLKISRPAVSQRKQTIARQFYTLSS